MTRFDEDATCKCCGGELREGKALVSTAVGSPDFYGDDTIGTMSSGGPGRLVDVLKCRECGWSVSSGDRREAKWR